MGYQPIRWDNVGGSSLAEASRPLDAAARAFDMGFGSLRNVLDQRSAIQDSNFQAGVKNNTNEVMNRLMGVDGVDAFKAAKAGLGATLDGYGAQIDQQAIRNFADQRVGVLQDRELKSIEYNHKTLDEAQAKDRDRIAGMLASGDKTQIDAAMKELPNIDLRVKADLYQNGNNAQRQLIDRAHADQEHDWKGEMNKATIKHMAADSAIGFMNANTAKGQLGVAQRNATVNEANAMAVQADRLNAQIEKARAGIASTYAEDPNSEAGRTNLEETFTKIEDPKDRKQARLMVAEAQKKFPTAPTSVLRQVASGIDADYAIDMFVRSGGVGDVGKLMKGTDSAAQAKIAEDRRNEFKKTILGLEMQRDKLGSLFGGSAAALTPTAPADTTVPNPFSNPTPVATQTASVTPATLAAAAQAQAQPAAAPAPVVNSVMAPKPLSFQEQILAGQAALRQQNVQIADRERMQALLKQKAEAQSQYEYAQKKVDAISAVTDKNPNKAVLLKRAEEERDRLKALLGN